MAVYEQDPVPGTTGPRTLVFESPTARTMVKDFPDEWTRMSDDELAAIRRSAS